MKFYKYQGAGNDFIIIDNRKSGFAVNEEVIRQLCNRHFGIGADGFMMLENDTQSDFYMRYFNADGRESTMCGNGGRCMAAFAQRMGVGTETLVFNSTDGLHTAEIISTDANTSIVKLKMIDVSEIVEESDFYFLNTGSPHYVCFVDNVANYDVVNKGRHIRNSNMFAPGGTNVNFVQLTDNGIFVRTYERGVEDETLACGTGATASAIATALFTESEDTFFEIKTLGGNLTVSFERDENIFKNVYLQGAATFVFEGEIN